MATRRCEMDEKMDFLGDTVTDHNVWEKLEEKVGYIAFFHHFHDNPLAGFPRTKFKLSDKMMHMKYFFVKNTKKVGKNESGEIKKEEKLSCSKKSLCGNTVSGETTSLGETVSANGNSAESDTEVLSSEMKTSGDKIIEPSVIEPQATPGKAILGEGGSKMLAQKTTKGESSPHEITSKCISGENIPAKKVIHGVVDPATSDERKFIRNEQPANTNTLNATKVNENPISIASIPKSPVNEQIDDTKANDTENIKDEKNPYANYFSNDNDIDEDLEPQRPLPYDGNNASFVSQPNPATPAYPSSSSDAASSSTGTKKRRRSPSPPPARDAPSVVEHEGTEMSGKSPGAKRRRFDKNASSPDALLGSSPTEKRSLEIDDSADSLDNEGEVVSSKRLKTGDEKERKRGNGTSKAASSKELELSGFESPKPVVKTSNEPKKTSKGGSQWYAAKRYHSATNNSLPDYGPLDPRLEKPNPQQEEPMRGRPTGRGSFRPVNRLVSNDSQDSASLESKFLKPKAFNLHGDSHPRPDHNPHKKQRLESGWVDMARSRDAIDDDFHSARSTHDSATIARPGHGRDLHNSPRDVSRAISPQRINRGRNMLQESISDGQMAKNDEGDRFKKPQGRYSKPEASKSSAIPPKPRRILRGDDPKDPIADADMTIGEGLSASVPEVIIKGLPGSKFLSPPRPKGNSARDCAEAQLIDSEDSMDDLSVDHYTKPRSNLSSKRKRSEPQSTPPLKEALQAETIHDSSDEEIGMLEKGNIQPAAFQTSKKAAPETKRSRQDRYQVLQVYSSKHPWLLDDPKKEWFFVYNRIGGSLGIEGQNIPPHFYMTTNSISMIIYCEESSKLIIRKSSDNSFGGATNILFTLTNSDHSVKLAKELSLNATIKALTRDREYLERAFAKYRQTALSDLKSRPPAKDGPASISPAIQKSHLRSNAMEETVTRGPRIIDQLCRDVESGVQHTRSKKFLPPNKAESNDQTIFDLTVDEFYDKASASKNKQQASRSSARLKDEIPPSRRGSVGEVEWTVANPEWKQIWKEPIVYPPKGRDKATIDSEEIERLDEGQFLNDNLIEFYIRWMEQHILKSNPEKAKRIHIMNTFFYERLTTNKNGKKGFNYEAVQRWTSKIDLLSYDYIVVPVNEHTHWYVAIICNAPKLLGQNPEAQETSQSQQDAIGKGDRATTPEPTNVTADVVQDSLQKSTPTKKGKRKSHGPPPRKYKTDEPRIITLDSLGVKHSPTCTNLKEYLIAEIKAKHGIEIPTPGAIGMTATNIPQQDNYSDCGLFLLNYVERFLQQPDEFIHSIMQNVVDIQSDVWPTAPGTRNKIRDILFNLQAQQLAKVDENKQVEKDDGITSEITKANQSSSSESLSPGGTTSPSLSSEQAPKQPIPEQSVTTPTEVSSENISRLGSPGAGETSVEEDEQISVIHKPTRERRPTPFPAGHNEKDGDENDGLGSPSTIQHDMESAGDNGPDLRPQSRTRTIYESGNEVLASDGQDIEVSGGSRAEDDSSGIVESHDTLSNDEEVEDDHSEGDEMLLNDPDDTRATRSPARSPSPRLLSDPSFSSVSSSTTPEQHASKTSPFSPLSAATMRHTGSPIGNYQVDAADAMIIGKAKKFKQPRQGRSHN